MSRAFRNLDRVTPCQVAPEQIGLVGTASAAGAALWLLPIPGDNAALGAVFFQQAAVLAPGANPFGMLWSNGGRGKVGLR